MSKSSIAVVLISLIFIVVVGYTVKRSINPEVSKARTEKSQLLVQKEQLEVEKLQLEQMERIADALENLSIR